MIFASISSLISCKKRRKVVRFKVDVKFHWDSSICLAKNDLEIFLPEQRAFVSIRMLLCVKLSYKIWQYWKFKLLPILVWEVLLSMSQLILRTQFKPNILLISPKNPPTITLKRISQKYQKTHNNIFPT